MSSVIDGDNILAANLIILGARPLMPVAFIESSLFMNDITWPRVIRGIWKIVSPGNLLFVKCCSLSMSISDVLSEFLLRISDIDVKYLFNSIAIFSDFVMFYHQKSIHLEVYSRMGFCYQWIINGAK